MSAINKRAGNKSPIEVKLSKYKQTMKKLAKPISEIKYLLLNFLSQQVDLPPCTQNEKIGIRFLALNCFPQWSQTDLNFSPFLAFP